MSLIFSNDLVVALLFGLCIFFISYLWLDKIMAYFYRKSTGSKEEILELMEKMYINIEPKKVKITLYLISYGLGAVVFLLFFPNIIPGLLLGSIVTLIGLTAPRMYMRSLWEKRCDRIVDQMVDGLTIMANGVKSNLTVQQCFDRVITNMSGPLVQEFRMIKEEMALGRPLSEALVHFGERVPRQDVNMFVTSINILEETGGKLSETFETIMQTIRERQKLEKKIQALTAQGRVQAIILSLVPFGLLAMFAVMAPNFVMPLFTRPLGWFALFLMLTLQILGGLAMKKVVTIKV